MRLSSGLIQYEKDPDFKIDISYALVQYEEQQFLAPQVSNMVMQVENIVLTDGMITNYIIQAEREFIEQKMNLTNLFMQVEVFELDASSKHIYLAQII